VHLRGVYGAEPRGVEAHTANPSTGEGGERVRDGRGYTGERQGAAEATVDITIQYCVQ